MIVMAADYVGSKVIDFLCDNSEKIQVLVVDTQDRGGFNESIIKNVKESNPNVEILSHSQIKEKNIQEHIKSKGLDIGVLAWWPYIITSEMIELTKRGFVNTHPGFLPYNRGKHPYFWNIVDQTPFGATLHYVEEDIDSGATIAQERIECDWEDTGESLYNKSRELILQLFRDNFDSIKNGTASVIPKVDCEGSFHHGKELKPFCSIDLDEKYTARMLFNILRGRMFHGSGEAIFTDNGRKYAVSIYIKETFDHDENDATTGSCGDSDSQ